MRRLLPLLPRLLPWLLVCLLVCLLVGLPFAVATALAAPTATAGERRVALVIGNGVYPVAPLKNPVNDARDMAAALRGAGFEVILRENAGLRQMNEAIDQFWTSLKRGGVGLFFFAGHGVQVAGENYLVPVDARIAMEKDVQYECVNAGKVLGRMEDAGNGLNIVILDACRNNPFARSFRSADRGLAKMDAPTGSLIAFATAPGDVAADGEGKNGLYTSHLLKHLNTPGLTIENVLKRTRIGVASDSSRLGRKQTPWESSSLMGDFFFVGGGAPMPAQTASLGPVPASLPVAAPVPQAMPARPKEEPKQAPPPSVQADTASRLVGKYAEYMPEHGKNNGLFFEFSLKDGALSATTSGWTGGVTPVEVSGVRIEGETLRFRFAYKQGLFGMGGATYTDYACDLSGGLDSLPATYVTAKGNRGRVEFHRQGPPQAASQPPALQAPPAAPPKSAAPAAATPASSPAPPVAEKPQVLAAAEGQLSGTYRLVGELFDYSPVEALLTFSGEGSKVSGHFGPNEFLGPVREVSLDNGLVRFVLVGKAAFFQEKHYRFTCSGAQGLDTLQVVSVEWRKADETQYRAPLRKLQAGHFQRVSARQ